MLAWIDRGLAELKQLDMKNMSRWIEDTPSRSGFLHDGLLAQGWHQIASS
jgi:hypothetical protein